MNKLSDMSLITLIVKPSYLSYLVALAAVEFVRGALFFSVLPTYLPHALHFQVWQVGLILSVQYAADLLPKTWLSSYSDRFGPWPVLLPGFVVAAAAVVAMPVVTHFWLYLVIGLFFGLGASAVWPSVIAGITRLAPDELRGRALGSVFVAWIGGGGLGPLMAILFSNHHIHLIFHILVIVSVVPVIIAVFALLTQHDWQAQQETVSPGHWLRGLWETLTRIWPLVPGMIIQTMAIGLLMPILVPYLQKHFHLTPLRFAILLVAGGGTAVVSLLPAGWISDRFGPQRSLVTGLLLAASMIVTAVYIHSLWAALLPVAAAGFGYALILPAWNTLVTSAIPEDERARMMGFMMTIEGVGTIIGPTIGGALVSFSGSAVWAFWAAAVILGLMGVVYLFLPLHRYQLGVEQQ